MPDKRIYMDGLKILIISGLAMGLCSCATATRGLNEGLKVNSEPAGARALTNLKSKRKDSLEGYYGCEPTPCAISLPRKSAPLVSVSKDGYQSIKFKVTSAIATSATSIPRGSLVAGLPPGSHVVAGDPEFLKKMSAGSAVITGGIMTLGAGAVLDVATGANKNLAPNPVTVFLAPLEEPEE